MDYFLGNRRDPCGSETARLAREYAQNHNVDYLSAVKSVLRDAGAAHEAAKARAERHRKHSERLGWKIYLNRDDSVAEASLRNTGAAINRLSSLVVSLPKLRDGSIDTARAVKLINEEFGDLAQSAAGNYLTAVVRQWMEYEPSLAQYEKTTNPLYSGYGQCLKRAMEKHPATARVYTGRGMTEAGLREMLWPIFDPQRFASRSS